jgi:hypothetical protein
MKFYSGSWFIILLVSLSAPSFFAADSLDTARIEQASGLKGVLNEKEGVFKVMAPRTDVKVSVDQAAMPPFMGLTSWAAFKSDPKGGAMVMGDLVVFPDEVNPVMSVLFDNGVSVTALHNHFFFDEPKVYFMHIGGVGEAEKLATGVQKALAKVKEIRAAAPVPANSFGGAALPEKSSVTAASIDEALGVKGMAKDGMYKAVIGREAKMACGCEVGKEMGVNTWAAFMGSDNNAIVDGDFVVLESELQPVLKALRAGGINIVAIHHHMIEETPRYIFLHYWGKGETAALAKTVRSALDLTGKK